jgi:hypothetical protein
VRALLTLLAAVAAAVALAACGGDDGDDSGSGPIKVKDRTELSKQADKLCREGFEGQYELKVGGASRDRIAELGDAVEGTRDQIARLQVPSADLQRLRLMLRDLDRIEASADALERVDAKEKPATARARQLQLRSNSQALFVDSKLLRADACNLNLKP